MKFCKYIFVIPMIVVVVSSCKKSFLDVPNKNNVLRQAYVIDLKTTGDFLNGIYVKLAVVINHSGLNYPEVAADNIKPITGSSVLPSQYAWNQQADNSFPGEVSSSGVNVNGLWGNGIQMAQGCSFVLESADKYFNENTQLADNIKGQALALRAFIHSMMVNVFAQSYFFTPDASHPGIPYTKTSDWTKSAKRLSVAEVYDAMIADLQAAIQLLPNTQTVPSGFKYSLITKAAAKAILARVYLFKGDWAAAKNTAREVVTTVPIMTGTNYPSKLFTNNETEALFQLPPSSSGVTSGAGTHNTFFSAIWYSAPIQQLVATNDIVSILKENPMDVRNVWVELNGSNWGIKKFPSNIIPGFTYPSVSYFQTLIRSSEMYLTAAESYAMLNNQDSAVFYLDAIRIRAWSAAPPTLATGAALLDSICKERRKELAFEGLRMFDIQRWKQAVNRIDAPIPTAQNLPYGSDKAIAPIPTSDVDQLGMEQNPGY